ncbi:hypothetical protein GIB67_041829 [Kingdonia uniflora]|uniref:AAA+ ATPase domain-containing protein n=1 Tax=Kingdonia uniflora TaxID=39325 RepID=A0A7J7L5P9_9MAGN|nr:hypothetical protein GIB67_041829 [Kingdonia uniflora]
MEIASAPIIEVGKCAAVSAKRRLGYIIHYKRNVEDLQNKVDKDLVPLVANIRRKVDFVLRRGEVIHKVVEGWLHKVKDVRNKQAELNQGVGEITSWRSFTAVSDPAPLPPRPLEHFNAFESRQSTKKQVIQSLKADDTYLVGIYGMGGVGKTTLVKEIHKEVEETKLFDKVVMVVVSQNPDLKRIQGEIAEQLGMEIEEEGLTTRALRLYVRLMQEKTILVILDDLWSEVDVAAIGIPHGGCKVVITTRSRDICSRMEAKPSIQVQVLSEADSWELFRQNAGDVVDSDALHLVSKEVANECKGLPLAIVTIAKALRGKDREMWIYAAQQLKKSSFDGMSAVNTSIKFSEELFEDAETLGEARNKLHAAVDKLLSASLLLEGKDDGDVMTTLPFRLQLRKARTTQL